MGAILPFHPTIGITRLGLGAGNLAAVYTVQQFLFIVIKPIIGYITDYTNNLKNMIVTFTIVNVLLSYMLLGIPKIEERKTELSDLPNFCELCRIPDQLQRIEEDPFMSDISHAYEFSCDSKNLLFEATVSQCATLQVNPSQFNVTYKIDICFISGNDLIESKTNFVNSSVSQLYITVDNHINFFPLRIVCPKIENITRLGDINFNMDFMVKSCFKYAYNLTDNRNSAGSTTLSNRSSHPNDVICNDSEPQADGGDKLQSIESFKTYHFWLYAILILTSCMCTSSIFTLSDTACHEAVQKTGGDYGNQRAWGALGWGLCAPLAGFLSDYTDSYWSAMGLMTLLNVLQILNISKLDMVKPQPSQSIMKDVRTVLSSADFVAFEVGVLMNGIGVGIVWHFLPWFIHDIGGTRLLIGLVNAVQCFGGEMPFMFISGWLIRRIGHHNAVTLALLATSVRFLAYSSLKNPWMILPIECLDGITFGTFLATVTSYGKLKAKPGTEATTQALLSSTYEGFGAGLGCVIAGACFDNYGGYRTFFYAGFFFAGATAINVASSALLFYTNRSNIRKEDFIISVVVSKETICENIRY